MHVPGPSASYRWLLSTVFFMSFLMTTVALLRKQTSRGVSTWRFCEDPSGSCYAIDRRSRRRWFSDRRQMDRAITNWRGYGYTDFVHTEPVRRGAQQLLLQLAVFPSFAPAPFGP